MLGTNLSGKGRVLTPALAHPRDAGALPNSSVLPRLWLQMGMRAPVPSTDKAAIRIKGDDGRDTLPGTVQRTMTNIKYQQQGRGGGLFYCVRGHCARSAPRIPHGRPPPAGLPSWYHPSQSRPVLTSSPLSRTCEEPWRVLSHSSAFWILERRHSQEFRLFSSKKSKLRLTQGEVRGGIVLRRVQSKEGLDGVVPAIVLNAVYLLNHEP